MTYYKMTKNVFIITYIMILFISTSSISSAAEPQTIQIITLPTGSQAYRVGVTLAAAINRLTNHQAIVAGYGGAQVIVPMLQNNRAEFALINADDATRGHRGIQPFRRSNDNIRLVSKAYSIFAGVAVAKDSPIKTIDDIKGKRVTGIFSSHKSCELVAEAQMANIGLDRKDVKTVPVTNPIGSIQALADGRADVALCLSPGIPAALEANAKIGIRYISMDPSSDAINRLKQVFNVGGITRKLKGDSPDIAEDGIFLVYDYYLVSSTHVPDEIVQEVLHILWNEHGTLVKENKDFASWTQERMGFKENPIPYHTGANQFFNQMGVDLSVR
jgi:uncharacterized protein